MTLIKMTCQGTEHHEQTIRVDDALGFEYAMEFGKIMDGTSDMFVVPRETKVPGLPNRAFRCVICGELIDCVTTKEADQPITLT